jgi:hypothetical protein
MNSLAHYFVPQWILITFLVVIPLPFVLIALFLRKEALKLNLPIVFPSTILFFIAYLSYILLASLNGWFDQVYFPPRVILLTTLPYALFLFGIFSTTSTYKKILENSSYENLIRLHSFRIIGIFFILLAVYDALPKAFAFIAGLGDIITAITSFWVANAIQNKKSYARRLAYLWNIFGTVDILFTAIAANVLTKLSIDTGIMGVDTLALFPFCIIPAFAPPTILFLHWSIFKKLNTFSA